MIRRSMIVLASIMAVSTAAHANSSSFEDVMVNLHNKERSEVGSAPLKWDNDLARSAAVYARTLAKYDRFEHDPSNRWEGENLWMGTRSYYSFTQMVNMWSQEKLLLPRLRRWYDDTAAVGHYTQMVWKDTTRVGCAIASNREWDYLVCRYGPQGNYTGKSPYTSGGMSMP